MPLKFTTRDQFPACSNFSCSLSHIYDTRRMMKRQTPELDELCKRVRRLTKADGAKPALADHLGVHVSLFYGWLAGRNEPGGEATLRMQKWADEAEDQPQKKRPDVLQARPTKARKKANQTNEKPTPRPLKK